MGVEEVHVPVRGNGSRAVRAGQARVLGRAFLIAAAVLVFAVVVPFSPTAPRALGVVLAVVATVLGVTLTRGGHRVSALQLHALVVLASALITLLLLAATTPGGAVVTAVGYQWVATFSAAFHTRRALLSHLAVIAVGMGAGLWFSDVTYYAHAWVILMVTFAGVALVLQGQVGALRREATTDALTGVLTRRTFRLAAEIEMARAARTGQPLTLAILDLDDFKQVNDDRGHAAGDAVLHSLAAIWQNGLRAQDTVGRFGGDEFTVLLPGAGAAEAAEVLSRLGGQELCRWSAGLASWQGQSFEDWFRAADRDLYAEKSIG